MKANGNKIIFLVVAVFSLLHGGNKKMVEQNIDELDSLNKKIVQKSGEIPKDGKILLKAYVVDDKNSSTNQIFEREIDFNTTYKKDKGDDNVTQ